MTDELNPTGHVRLDWAIWEAVYRDVHVERIRAHNKHGAAGNSREDARWDNAEWLPILVEEVGEVAHELTYDVQPGRDELDGEAGVKARLRKELVQVAAMACAWIAAIEESFE